MVSHLNRRDFVRWTGAGMAAAALGAPRLATGAENAPKGAEGKAGARPPNFIVILADDLGAKELGCYGGTVAKTPNLDELARTGAMFKTCYATPLCHPTRFMLMTGQYAHHNGVYNFPNRPGGPAADDPKDDMGANQVTFADMLKPHGYATALSGKWQLSGRLPTLVYDCGFDEYCMWAYKQNLPEGYEHKGGWETPGKTSRYWHPCLIKNGQPLPTKPTDYGPDIFNDFVIDFIKRKKDQPFFVYYTSALTHGPHYSTPDTTKNDQDKFKNLKENFPRCLEYLDKLVGKLVRALDEMGLRDNTIIFFTGDNGTGGEGKGQATELGCRCPMIVNCPGIVKPAAPRDELTDLTDVAATMVDLAKAQLPKDLALDGRSLAPILRGEKGVAREWIYSYLSEKRVLRDRRWLLEQNAPHNPGRFFDCGDSRDGKGYKDVTDSKAPEVVAARKRFDEILKDKPVPNVPPAEKGKGKAGAGKKAKAKGGKKAAKQADAPVEEE